MKRGGGKQKGASFERAVCWDLSRFIDPNGDDTLFWRAAMSGGRATVQHRRGIKNQTQAGDISCVHPAGHFLTENFVLECKFYRDLDIEASLLTNRGKLAAFWKVLQALASKHERHPLLIAKQNRTDTLVLFDRPGYSVFKTYKGTPKLLIESHLMGALVCMYNDVLKLKKGAKDAKAK